MNKIIEDFKDENFTPREYVVYGIIAPVILFAACALSNLIIG